MTILQIDNQYYSVLNWTNEGVVVAHLQTGATRCISYADFSAHVYAVQHDGMTSLLRRIEPMQALPLLRPTSRRRRSAI